MSLTLRALFALFAWHSILRKEGAIASTTANLLPQASPMMGRSERRPSGYRNAVGKTAWVSFWEFC
jgi:hypothetical protein